MSSPPPVPSAGTTTILVAEDDPASGHFFEAALQDRGCRVDLRSNGTEALECARRHRFDLLILDCRMPGGGALHLLSALRGDRQAASRATPALATSAEMDAGLERRLRRAGFAGTLPKPLTLSGLWASVQPWLPDRIGTAPAPPVLDDASALGNSGSMATVTALRELFARELDQLAGELGNLVDHPSDLSERLHRLLSSCGFCGATALAAATRNLKRQLNAGEAPSVANIDAFRARITDTLQALRDPPGQGNRESTFR